MKRIASIITSLVLLVMVAFTMTACNKEVNDFSTAGVISNGNLGVVKDSTLYYVDRLTSDRSLTGNEREKFGIYKVSVDEKCTPNGESELLFTALAGFESGQLFIYGNYIYFTTPADVTSSTGEKLIDRTTFCRVGLDGKDYRELYTTESDKEPTFAYYVHEEMLYLIVLQDTTLYSIKMDKKCTVTTIDTEVTSVALSENSGEGGNAESYVFYTKEPTESFITQTGHNVYRTTADGQNPELISSGQDVELLRVVNGYLYYSLKDEGIYRTTTVGGFTTTEAISYETFENYMILDNGGVVVVNKDERQIWYYNWTSGTLVSRCLVASIDYELLFSHNEFVYLQNTKKDETKHMMRVNLTDVSQNPVKLTDEAIEKAGNYMHYEVIGSTLFYYVKETVETETGSKLNYSKLYWKAI